MGFFDDLKNKAEEAVKKGAEIAGKVAPRIEEGVGKVVDAATPVVRNVMTEGSRVAGEAKESFTDAYRRQKAEQAASEETEPKAKNDGYKP